MQGRVMLCAQPAHLERLGIVLVMAVHFGIAADLTRLPLDLAGAHCLGELVARHVDVRLLGTPAPHPLVVGSLPLRQLVSCTIVGASCFALAAMHAHIAPPA